MEEKLSLRAQSLPEIAEAMEQNMVRHMSWATERLPGATVLHSYGLTLVDSGYMTDTFNVICGARLSPDDADAAILDAIGYFRERSAPFSWWVGPTASPSDLGERLVAHGLAHVEDETGMVLDLSRIHDVERSVEGVKIIQATSPGHLIDLARVVAANWDPPDHEVAAFYSQAASIVLSAESPLRFWIAYTDGQPVAACESVHAAGVAGVYAVVTLQAYRRRGIGSATTRTALVRARAEGYSVATLQASGQGKHIYERIGFVPCGMFHEFKPVT